MRFGRTLAPAAAPLTLGDLCHGLLGLFRRKGELQRRRTEFCHYFGMRHCFFVSSGTSALALILGLLKEIHPDRDEVLIPALTCYSVPSAIVAAGLRPVLCDIEPGTLDFNFDQLQGKLTNPKLLCVVPTHLLGLPGNLSRLRGMLRDNRVMVVEDAAQALGGEWQGHKLGTLGDVNFFSLGRGKALSAVEGGVILTQDDELGRRLRDRVTALPSYRVGELLVLLGYALALSLLLRPCWYWLPASLPFLKLGTTRFDPHFRSCRMTGFQAGLLSGWQGKLARLRRIRRDHVRYWAMSLPGRGLPAAGRGDQNPDLIRFPLLAESAAVAEKTVAEGVRHGLGLAMTYPDAVSGIAALREEFAGEDYPVARRTARQLVTLPVHSFVSYADRTRILRLLADVAAEGGAAAADFSGGRLQCRTVAGKGG